MEKEAAGEVGSAGGGGGAECERVLRSNESGRAGVALEWQYFRFGTATAPQL